MKAENLNLHTLLLLILQKRLNPDFIPHLLLFGAKEYCAITLRSLIIVPPRLLIFRFFSSQGILTYSNPPLKFWQNFPTKTFFPQIEQYCSVTPSIIECQLNITFSNNIATVGFFSKMTIFN